MGRLKTKFNNNVSPVTAKGNHNDLITKTCPNNAYTFIAHFYVAKLGYGGVDCGYSLGEAAPTCTKNLCFEQK